MEIKEKIELKIQEIESLQKNYEQLYIEKSKFRRLKDVDNERKIWKQIREINSKIDECNLEIGSEYEKQALALNPEERLPLLLRALEYYKKSSYTESIRILIEAKQITVEIKDSNLTNFCEAQIIYFECKELDYEAEKLWNSIRECEITEHNEKCIQLSIFRDNIIKKLKDGLKHAEESNSLELVIDFYRFLTWNLYRRCDGNEFFSEIKKYHRKAAVLYECLAWKNCPTNREVSQNYLHQASSQYLEASSSNDKDRIVEILSNAFDLNDHDYFTLKYNNIKSMEDLENLETLFSKKKIEYRDWIISILKSRKAGFYSDMAVENIDDKKSFFIAAQYYEESHKICHADSEIGADMGESFSDRKSVV